MLIHLNSELVGCETLTEVVWARRPSKIFDGLAKTVAHGFI